MTGCQLSRQWSNLLIGLLVLSACGGLGKDGMAMPIPLDTQIATTRPTLPPTFTPSPTVTAVDTPTLSPTPAPSITPSLTPTIEPVPTQTPTMPPTVTVTWTPDARLATPSDSTTPTSRRGTDCSEVPGGINLLENGSFEGGQYWYGSGNLYAPEGWAAFWKEGGQVEHDPENQEGYRQPEMWVIRSDPPFNAPPRVRDGFQALYITGGNRVFDAGTLQQVVVTPGDTYCLTGYAHAWSAHRSGDPYHSQLDTDDDRRNMNFMLGIDPTGGSDPWSSEVLWGETVHLYDKYHPIPGVQARAGGLVITVFVRGYTLWRFDHNDMFFDTISLVRIEP